MTNKYIYRSVGLHAAIFLILILDLPFFGRAPVTMGQAPIIVDLQNVKLSEMTNLPPKAVIGEEEKKAAVSEAKKPQPKWTTDDTKAPELPPAPKETIIEEPKRDFLDTTKPEPQKPAQKPDPKPKPKTPVKPQNKPAPKPAVKPKPKTKTPEVKKTPPAKKTPPNKTIANPLKSLMESVNSLEKEIGQEETPAVIKKDTQVNNMGIEGGTTGSYFSDLTISETDAIAGRLRECWNLDPGARGIENMVIEIRAYLNRDGSIRDVQILDSGRFNSDPHFRAIAESARRAVYTCSNKNNVNIYKIFPEKYADKYGLWNTLLLRFNPMDATVK